MAVKTGALPFALESSLHAPIYPRSAMALSALDAGPRRALYAMSHRSRMQLAGSGLLAADPPMSPRAAQPSYVPSSADATDDPSYDNDDLPSPQLSPVASPPLTPRSLTIRPRRRRSKARQRWALIRANLTRIVREETLRSGDADLTGATYASRMWSSATQDWQYRAAESALRALPAFQEASDKELHALLDHVSVQTVQRYSEVWRRGQPLVQTCVLLQGAIRISGPRDGAGSLPSSREGTPRSASGQRRVLKPGAIMGGGAWLECAVQVDSASALQPCVIAVIRSTEARRDTRLLVLASRLTTSLGNAWKEELLTHHVPIFSDLPLRTIRQLAPMLSPRLVSGGKLLAREGDAAEEVFVLVQGEVSVFREAKDDARRQPAELARITHEAGVTIFGELALLYRRPRAASVKAVEGCFLLVLAAADFP